MTFYLKYRPQNLEELDQESVRITLEKIVKSKNIPHAFLFSGPKGTGKTSAARILAKIINCEHKDKKGSSQKAVDDKLSFEPCNECEQCISITKGQNIDVVEIDAASHRGIDDIRMIRDAVKLSPAKALKKVYIIDEAHMLTAEASNALLKTLEEPPSHVVFILATTNPEKLIDTVRSRVTNVPFKKATPSEIAKSLGKIAEKEGIKIETKFFEIIASKSDGSFRDATKIFEQMILEGVDFSKGLEDFLSENKTFDIKEFLKFIAEKDAKDALEMIEVSIDGGLGAKDVAREILENLRNMLLSQYGLKDGEKGSFAKDDLILLIKIFSDASAKIQTSLIEQVPLEIAVVEWCEQIQSITSTISTKGINGGENEKVEKTVKNRASNVGEKVSKDSESVDEQLKRMTSRSGQVDSEVSQTASVISGDGSDVAISDKIWREILGKVAPGHTSTEALLRAAKPLEFNGSTLKLGVYYKFHKERLEEKQHRDILEEALKIYIGSPVRVVCTLTEPPPAPTVHSDESNVVLTEPKEEIKPDQVLNDSNGLLTKSDLVLTQNNNPDIIKLAEEIFSN